MIYRGTEKEVKLPITFYHHKEKLERAVCLPNNTAGKAVAYELYDHGEYFIIKAIIEAVPPLNQTNKARGSVGIDINTDHIALSQIDAKGNLCHTYSLAMQLKGKTSNQRKNIYVKNAVLCNLFAYQYSQLFKKIIIILCIFSFKEYVEIAAPYLLVK